MSIYTSLFSNKNKPMSSENKAEFDKLTQQAEEKLATMSEDEKVAEFNRIMGRVSGDRDNLNKGTRQ